MMVLVARLRMPWFGTKVVLSKTRAPSFRLIVDHATLPGPPRRFDKHLVYFGSSSYYS